MKRTCRQHGIHCRSHVPSFVLDALEPRWLLSAEGAAAGSDSDLPDQLILDRMRRYTPEPHGGQYGVGVGPDGNLWMASHLGVQRIRPVDGNLLDANDQISLVDSAAWHALTFDNQGRMLLANLSGSAVLRDAINGVFYDSDDQVTPFNLFDATFGNGSAEIFGLDVDAYGRVFALGLSGGTKKLAIVDPLSGDLTDGQVSRTFFTLPFSTPGLYFGVAVDQHGLIYLSYLFSKVVVIDPVDGTPFNGDDVVREFTVAGHPTGMDFDADGRLYYWETDRDRMFRYVPFHEPQSVPGDLTDDGIVDAQDIDLAFLAVKDGTSDPRFDLNVDGDVNMVDVDYLVRVILNTEYGDINLDGKVGTRDLSLLALAFNSEGGWGEGDTNGDGLVGIADLSRLAIYFGFDNMVSGGGAATIPSQRSDSGVGVIRPITLFTGIERFASSPTPSWRHIRDLLAEPTAGRVQLV